MAWIFSKRCKPILKDGRLKVSIPTAVRYRIYKALEKFDISYEVNSDTGYNSWTSSLRELPDMLKSELGCVELRAYVDGKQGVLETTGIEGFILRGNYPPNVFDAIEQFYNDIGDKDGFQKDKPLYASCFKH